MTERPFGPGGRPLGINLYMVAEDYAADPQGTLAKLADIGLREVEAMIDSPLETLREGLARTGLACPSLCVAPQSWGEGLSLQSEAGRLAERLHGVGARYLTCILFPLPDGVRMERRLGESRSRMWARLSRSLTADHFRRAAERFNAVGAELRRHDARLAYHNHNPELAPLGETNGLAILVEQTDPDLVAFEMDAGWVAAAGQDPATWLKAYPGRFQLMHVKDLAPSHRPNTRMQADATEVGRGVVDWARVLRIALDSGVRHFALEQEPPYARMPPMAAARAGYDHLASLEV